MRIGNLPVLVLAAALAAALLVVAGCGGGGSESSAGVQASSAGRQTKHSSESDCRSLGHVTSDLALADAGFEYVRDRDFIDGYADRAPDEITDSVERIRGLLDRFASAAEKAGLEPGDMALPDQADEIKGALDYSDDEQADNGRALQTVDTWVTNGCGS